MTRKRTPDDSTKQNEPSLSRRGRFSYDGLDRVLHEKARLGILASLAAHTSGLVFNDLKRLCSLTDGNLSRHLAVLNQAGLVETWKATSGARPQTLYRLTADGRKRFAEYISVLEEVVADSHLQQKPANGPELSGGWSPT